MLKRSLHHLAGHLAFQCKRAYRALSHQEHRPRTWLRCSPSRQPGIKALIFSDTILNSTELHSCLTLGCSHITPKSYGNVQFRETLAYLLLNLINLDCAASEQFKPHLFRSRFSMNSTRTTNKRLVLSKSVVLNFPNAATL